MMITRTIDLLVDEYKLRMALQPTLQTSVVGYTPGIDLDAMLRLKIRDWYYHQLDTADPRLLPVTDISDATETVFYPDMTAEILLPTNCRRVVSVRLADWHRDALIVTDMTSQEAINQSSEFSRGGAERPVALLSGNRLTLYSASSPRESSLTSLRCIMEPTGDSFTFDESLLASLEEIEFSFM